MTKKNNNNKNNININEELSSLRRSIALLNKNITTLIDDTHIFIFVVEDLKIRQKQRGVF